MPIDRTLRRRLTRDCLTRTSHHHIYRLEVKESDWVAAKVF